MTYRVVDEYGVPRTDLYKEYFQELGDSNWNNMPFFEPDSAKFWELGNKMAWRRIPMKPRELFNVRNWSYDPSTNDLVPYWLCKFNWFLAEVGGRIGKHN